MNLMHTFMANNENSWIMEIVYKSIHLKKLFRSKSFLSLKVHANHTND